MVNVPLRDPRVTHPTDRGGIEVERQTVIVEGCEVPFSVAGRGDPVVLVHGLCGSSRWWTPTLALAQRYRVYLVDLPGFGSLRHLGQQFALATASEWIRIWMNAVGLEQPSIVGHSMGAHIALRLAIDHPSRVRRLVIIAPAGIVPVGSVLAHCGAFARAARLTSRQFLVTLARDVFRAQPSAVRSAASALGKQDLRAELPSVSMPTLVICGDRDPLVSLPLARLIARTIRSAQLVVLQSTGHIPMFENPIGVNQALTRFLASRPIPRRPCREAVSFVPVRDSTYAQAIIAATPR
jgi:pimeloyl-ACP methyl ester carboxylesterase